MRMLTSRGAEHYAHWICDQCQSDAYLRSPIKGLLRMRTVPNCPYCNGTMQLKKAEQKIFYEKTVKKAVNALEKVRRFVISLPHFQAQHMIVDTIVKDKEDLEHAE